MSYGFYSEIRGSLNQHDTTNINPETLKRLFQLFTREKIFFEKARETETGINNHSYTERSLFATLNGYTSTELFMSRLSPQEKNNIILLSNLITNWIRKKIIYHDFDTLIAIGSSTYRDTYRSELQSSIDDINYEVINPWKKEVYENMNSSREYITKEQIQETINKKGNDIDLVLTWFSWWGIASNYNSYYQKNLRNSIIKNHHRDYINQVLEQFIYKDISQEDFFSMVEINNIELFKALYKELQDNNEYWAEEFAWELLKKHTITLSKEWIKNVPPLNNETIQRFLSIKNTIESQEEFVRSTYLHKFIPQILQSNNILFTREEHREDWSYYHIDHTHKTITKQKHLNPNHNKDWCLIIQFPDCRPIHLNVDTSTIQDLYHHEQQQNKSFALLSHNHIEREKFLRKDRNNNLIVPEYLTLEEQIQYIKQNKPKIDWEKIIEKRKNQSITTEDKK